MNGGTRTLSLSLWTVKHDSGFGEREISVLASSFAQAIETVRYSHGIEDFQITFVAKIGGVSVMAEYLAQFAK